MEIQTVPLRVVHIEDDPLYTVIFERMIRHTNFKYTLKHFLSGAPALDYLASIPESSELPNLIVLDLHIPGDDSFKTLEKIKSNPRTMAIAVLVLSASEDKKDLLKTYQGGGVAFISKNSKEEVFHHALTQLKITGRL